MYKLFQLLTNGQTEELIGYLTHSVQTLKRAGTDFFVVMSGHTPYLVFHKVQQKVQPLMISIVEETFLNVKKVLLETFNLLLLE